MSQTTIRRNTVTGVVMATVLGLTLAACGSGSSESGATTSGGVTTLKLWTHNGGNNDELAIDQQIVSDFNASQKKFKVEVQAFPQASYNDAVTAAASAKKLPCIMDIDAPIVPSWAWAGYLQPLDLPAATLADQLPSTVGKVNGKVYSFGHYEAALAMVTRKSALVDNGIRIPTIAQPWTGAEFGAALARIKASGKFKYPLDLGTSVTAEWLPYAFSPFLQSFGGDLINRDGYTTANGTLNGPKAMEWAQWLQGLVSKGYIAAKSGADPGKDFANGVSAINWNGSWTADTVSKTFGDDVLFLPPPNFGNGAKIGGGSWQWGMSASCAAKDGALAYLKFSLDKKYVVDFATKLNNLPANLQAASQVPNYAPSGKYRAFLDMSQKLALVRPVTPAYPFISSTFQKAVNDLLAGGNAKQILDKAASDIDNNIKQNGDYKF